MLMDGVSGVQLGVLRAKIGRLVSESISDMENFKKSEVWKETDEDIDAINKKFAKKDEKGNFLTHNNMYVFDDIESRDKELKELENAKQKQFKERKKMAEEYKLFLNEECKEKLPKIPLSLFPKDTKTELIDLLWPVIDEKK